MRPIPLAAIYTAMLLLGMGNGISLAQVTAKKAAGKKPAKPAAVPKAEGSRRDSDVIIADQIFLTPGGKSGEGHSLVAITQRRITLETDRADPWDAILTLLRNAGVNYVIGGEATGGRKVTARFRDVPLEEALDALADAAGLNYALRRGIIILKASEPLVLSGSGYTFGGPYAGGIVPSTRSPGPSLSEAPAPSAPPGALDTAPAEAIPPTPQPPPAPSVESGMGAIPEDGQQVRIVQLAHRSAQEMVELIPSELPQLATLAFLKADPRTNSLVMAGTPLALESAASIIGALDVADRTVTRPAVLVKLHFFRKAGSLPGQWFSETYTKTPAGDPSTRIAVVRGVKSLEDLVKRVEAAGGERAASPAITTLHGVPAEIRISGEVPVLSKVPQASTLFTRERETAERTLGYFHVIPEVNTDGTITLSFTDRDPSLTPRAPERESGSAKGAGPGRIVRRVRQDEALALLRALPAEGKGNNSLLLIQARVQHTSQPPAAR